MSRLPFGRCVSHLYHPLFVHLNIWQRSRGSSVCIASDCRLDDRVIEVRSPEEAKDYSSSLCVQTSSEAYPAPCPMSTVCPFQGLKRCRGVTPTTHPHLMPRSTVSKSYTSSSPPWRVVRDFKPGPPEYKAEVLTTRPRCSVASCSQVLPICVVLILRDIQFHTHAKQQIKLQFLILRCVYVGTCCEQ
jgi:hypothetical protein